MDKPLSRPAIVFTLAITLVEMALLLLLLANVAPTGPAAFQEQAPYSTYLPPEVWERPVVRAARWLFFLPALVLIPMVLIHLAGLIRWLTLGRQATPPQPPANLWAMRAATALRQQATAPTAPTQPARSPSASDLTSGEPAWSEEPMVLRFDVHLRTQHAILLTAVFLAALTGFPQAFPDWPTSQWWIAFWGGVESARTVHRVAAMAMDFTLFYYLLYLARDALAVQRRLPRAMLLTGKDLQDMGHTLRFVLGREQWDPSFERFGYRQKMDYWMVAVTLPLMSLTGLMQVHPDIALRFLPPLLLALSVVVHRNWAIFFLGYLFITHFHHVHLAPLTFPWDPSIFTGRMPVGRYRRLHPLDNSPVLEASATEVGDFRRQEAPSDG